MQKKPSGKESTKPGKVRRKLSDLAPKKVRGSDANSVRGGDAGSKDPCSFRQ